MRLNEVKPYKHKMKIETLICFLVASLIFTHGLSANPDLPELKFTDYTVENGLSYNSVLSICQDASGEMYFGGTNGIEVFHPDKMPVNTDTVKPAWYRSTATRIIFAILVLGALASHACMTRGNLHLKLKNLTGKTPVELIKTMRMKRRDITHHE